VVLTGPPGIGKTATAVAFARWHARGVEPVVIGLAAEFHELSLVEAVGTAYPDELYRDHKGVSFVMQPFSASWRSTCSWPTARRWFWTGPGALSTRATRGPKPTRPRFWRMIWLPGGCWSS
jgi:hypothetical protein